MMINTDSNNPYYLLLQQLKDGIVLLDKDQRIIFVNEASEKIRNVSKDALIGQYIMDCCGQFSCDKVAHAIEYLTTHRDKSCYCKVVNEENQKSFDNNFISTWCSHDYNCRCL